MYWVLSLILQNTFRYNFIAQAITAAKKASLKIGLCGQAPSDFPAFSQFLVEHSIDSISFTPDALVKGIENIAKAENKLQQKN